MTPLEYEYLRKLLKDRSGLILAEDKRYLVESRLIPLARRAGVGGISELVQKMKAGAEPLIVSVVEAMTTNETFFFRDKLPFDHFKDTILPAMVEARKNRRTLRIWCAACSTGQEPYSLAMLLKEAAASLIGWRIEIVATDLSQEVLEKARSGIFSQFEVQRGLPIQLLIKYFTQTNEMWQLSPEIRGMVQFRQLNLLQDFTHLGVFDVIFCRNVLIYFDVAAKADVLDRLAKVSEADGFLSLGAAETVIGVTTRFAPCADRRGLYRPAVAVTPNVRSPSIVPLAAAGRIVQGAR